MGGARGDGVAARASSFKTWAVTLWCAPGRARAALAGPPPLSTPSNGGTGRPGDGWGVERGRERAPGLAGGWAGGGGGFPRKKKKAFRQTHRSPRALSPSPLLPSPLSPQLLVAAAAALALAASPATAATNATATKFGGKAAAVEALANKTGAVKDEAWAMAESKFNFTMDMADKVFDFKNVTAHALNLTKFEEGVDAKADEIAAALNATAAKVAGLKEGVEVRGREKKTLTCAHTQRAPHPLLSLFFLSLTKAKVEEPVKMVDAKVDMLRMELEDKLAAIMVRGGRGAGRGGWAWGEREREVRWWWCTPASAARAHSQPFLSPLSPPEHRTRPPTSRCWSSPRCEAGPVPPPSLPQCALCVCGVWRAFFSFISFPAPFSPFSPFSRATPPLSLEGEEARTPPTPH